MLTSYNFLVSLQMIFNLANGQLKFLDFFLSILSILGRRHYKQASFKYSFFTGHLSTNICEYFEYQHTYNIHVKIV